MGPQPQPAVLDLSIAAHPLLVGLFHAAWIAYALAWLAGLVRPRIGRALLLAGVAAHLAATTGRGWLIEFFPLTNKFESFSAAALCTAIVALVTWRDRRLYNQIVLGVVLIALTSWLLANRDYPPLLWSGDEHEYAEIARRIATGRGFTTGIIFPIEAEWGLDENHPSVLRPPLWPLILAGFFRVAGDDASTVQLALGTFFVATAAAAFGLGATLGGTWVGLVAGVAVAITADLRTIAMLGVTETLFAFWVTLFFLLLAREREPFWIGAVCGLAYLTRYNGGLLF